MPMDIGQNAADDGDAGQNDARQLLEAFCKNGFDGDEQRAAVALGVPNSDIREMLDGQTEVDDDLADKIRGIARERGITL